MENYESIESIEKELVKIEKILFNMAMTDRWGEDDARFVRTVENRKEELEEMLRERGCKV